MKIAKNQIELNDVVSINFKNVKNGKTIGYRKQDASVLKVGGVSFWVLNPFTGKQEAININIFLKANKFDSDSCKWQFVQKYKIQNLDYL